jgi:hypothetical protein
MMREFSIVVFDMRYDDFLVYTAVHCIYILFTCLINKGHCVGKNKA